MISPNWWLGRSIHLTLIPYVLTSIVLYGYWWSSTSGPWAPHNTPRYVPLLEALPILGGIITLYGILPRVRWIECQSPMPLRRLDAIAVLSMIASYSLLPILIRWTWSLSDVYRLLVPHYLSIADPVKLDDLAPYSLFAAFGFNIAAILGMTVLGISAFGPRAGPALGIVWFALLLTVQGHLGWGALSADGSRPEFSSIVAVGFLVALSIVTYAHQRAA